MNDSQTLGELIRSSVSSTFFDLLPIALVLIIFQAMVIRKKIPHLKNILVGMLLVLFGLSIFLIGLEECIFPLGTKMANQLTDLNFLSRNGTTMAALQPGENLDPSLYIWTYVFAFSIGFSTTMAEPALMAVAIKARQISLGAISEIGLRVSVALGAAVGVALGAYRIIEGTPLYIYIVGGYVLLLIQTWFAPKKMVPLAYDSGGVATSTVSVPLLTALGIGLASNVPGRSPLLDGFGLIAFACLFPMMSVLAYAMITEWMSKRDRPND